MRLLDTLNRSSFTIAFSIALLKLLQQPCSAFKGAQCILLALLERCRGVAGCGWGLLEGKLWLGFSAAGCGWGLLEGKLWLGFSAAGCGWGLLEGKLWLGFSAAGCGWGFVQQVVAGV
jgi:hypothetical protein